MRALAERMRGKREKAAADARHASAWELVRDAAAF